MTRSSVTSPLAGWMGGKRRLSSRLLPLLPPHRCYVEPFAGAGWLLFRKPRSRAEVLNDLNGEVVALYRVVQRHFPEFLRCCQELLVFREEFDRLAALPASGLTDIQRAVRFYYVQRLAFDGRLDAPSFSRSPTRPPRFSPARVERDLEAARRRLEGVYIEHLPYEQAIRRWDSGGTLFYLDPPYFGRENIYGRGLFQREDFARLAELLKGLRGRFLLSLNDLPEVRRLFADYFCLPLDASYSCSKNRGLRGRELVFANFELVKK